MYISKYIVDEGNDVRLSVDAKKKKIVEDNNNWSNADKEP